MNIPVELDNLIAKVNEYDGEDFWIEVVLTNPFFDRKLTDSHCECDTVDFVVTYEG